MRFLVAGLLMVLCASSTGASVDELTLDDSSAFAIGTEVNVSSVESLDAKALTDTLRASHERGASWTADPLRTGIELVGHDLSGRRRSVQAVYAPGEWEPGRPFRWVRVTVVDEGWLDDSVTGERFVFWLTPGEDGALRVHRALRAQLCHRPYWRYYSQEPCP